MHTRFLPFILILMGMLASRFVCAQGLTLITSAGGFASADDMHLSYSIGEPVIEYVPVGNTWLTQGYQQPGHVELMVSTGETPVAHYVQLYPNPANREITLSGFDPGECAQLTLHNVLGQPVLIASPEVRDFRISIEALQPGLYYATLQCNTIQFRTTSFIKL